jgi:hypothetical protein
MNELNELDTVRTKTVLVSDCGMSIPEGSTGTIVGIWKVGVAYIIEFSDPQALADAEHDQLEKVDDQGSDTPTR